MHLDSGRNPAARQGARAQLLQKGAESTQNHSISISAEGVLSDFEVFSSQSGAFSSAGRSVAANKRLQTRFISTARSKEFSRGFPNLMTSRMASGRTSRDLARWVRTTTFSGEIFGMSIYKDGWTDCKPPEGSRGGVCF